jgi:hypothetical protein
MRRRAQRWHNATAPQLLISVQAGRAWQGPAHHAGQMMSLGSFLANAHATPPGHGLLPMIVGHRRLTCPRTERARHVASVPAVNGQAASIADWAHAKPDAGCETARTGCRYSQAFCTADGIV